MKLFKWLVKEPEIGVTLNIQNVIKKIKRFFKFWFLLMPIFCFGQEAEVQNFMLERELERGSRWSQDTSIMLPLWKYELMEDSLFYIRRNIKILEIRIKNYERASGTKLPDFILKEIKRDIWKY